MADRIPDSNTPHQPGFVAQNTAQPAQIEMAGATAQGFGQLAGDIGKEQLSLEAMQARANGSTWLAQQTAQAEITRRDSLTKFTQANNQDPTIGGAGAGVSFQKEMADHYDELAETAPTNEARNAWLNLKADMGAKDFGEADEWQNKQLVNNFGQRLDDIQNNLATAAMRSKNLSDIQDLYKQADVATIAGSTFLPQNQLDKLNKGLKENIAVGYLDGRRMDNPYAAKAAIDSKVFDGVIGAEKLATMRNEADRAIRTQQAEARQATALKTSSTISEVKSALTALNAGTPVDITKIDLSGLPETQRKTVSEALNEANEFATAYQDVKWEDSSTVEKTLNDARQAVTDAGSDDPAKVNKARLNFERLQRAAATRQSQLNSDPYEYVMSSPNLQSAAQAVSDALPGQPQQQAQQAFATALVNEQQRLGVPDNRIEVMSKGTAQMVARQLNDQTDVGQVLGSVAKLQSTYGDNYGAVTRQLAQNGLEGSMNIVAARGASDPNMAANLLVGTRNSKALKELTADADQKVIKEEVASSFADFNATLPALWFPNATGKVASLQGSAQTLAMQYMQQGMSASSAATTATNKIINDHYDFNDTYRVPVEYREKNVPVMLANQLKEITNKQNFDLMNYRSGNPTAVERRLESADISSQAFWLTTPDDQGVVLMHPAYGPVKQGGKPVILRFDEMRQKDTPQTMVDRSLISSGF